MLPLLLAQYYLLLGAVFGVAFFVRGFRVIAPEAAGASLRLRLLWTPAAVALWPLLAVKWWRQR